MACPPLKGFLETSLVDWPGKVAAVVFLPGCNFRCPYCHNHPLVLHPETLSSWPLDRVLERVDALRDWLDGVCVTGGEPTLHGGLAELLDVFRNRGLARKLDTNGSRPLVVERLLSAGLVDAVSLDVKGPLEPVPYRRNAGPGARVVDVAHSLELLAAWGGPVEVRTTVHPALLSRDELCRLAAAAGRLAGEGWVFTPQRCRTDDPLDVSLREQPPLTERECSLWASEARAAFDAGRRGAKENTGSGSCARGVRPEDGP